MYTLKLTTVGSSTGVVIPKEMLKNLKRRIFEAKKLSLLEFFKEIKTRNELVLAFIAVLEIVRTESVKMRQTKTFGDIILRKV